MTNFDKFLTILTNLSQAEKIVGCKSQENKLLTQQIGKLKQRTEQIKIEKETEANITSDKGRFENGEERQKEAEVEEQREEARMTKLNIKMRFLRNEVIEEEEEGEDGSGEIYKTVTSRDEIYEKEEKEKTNREKEEKEKKNKEKEDWKEGIVFLFMNLKEMPKITDI